MRKRPLALALTTALAWCVATSTPADDDDIFFVATLQPNVIILFDSSGSMNGEIGGVKKMDTGRTQGDDRCSSGVPGSV